MLRRHVREQRAQIPLRARRGPRQVGGGELVDQLDGRADDLGVEGDQISMHALIIYMRLRFGKGRRMPDVAESERADLGAMVMRLGRRLLAMEQPILERHGVTMWAYVVLTALRDGPARAQASLAAAINADKTRLIPVLDDLQKRGLIEREPDPADRRVRLLGLTPEGRRLQEAVQSEIRSAEEIMLSKIKDQAAFVRALSELSA